MAEICFSGYDFVIDSDMRPMSATELRKLVEISGDTPFIVKGVLSVEDAKKCVEIGAKALIVSHHHGIMPSSVPPLLVLPEIKKAVGDQITIIVDCCIEDGVDAFKALALGADAVCVGRALMGPLKDGEDAAYEAIEKLSGQLRSVAARCGYSSVSGIDDQCVVIL